LLVSLADCLSGLIPKKAKGHFRKIISSTILNNIAQRYVVIIIIKSSYGYALHGPLLTLLRFGGQIPEAGFDGLLLPLVGFDGRPVVGVLAVTFC
jgi:hypothetical protein